MLPPVTQRWTTQYVIWESYKEEMLCQQCHTTVVHNTWVEAEYRLDISYATNGSHVEIYGTQDKKKIRFHSSYQLVSSVDSYYS